MATYQSPMLIELEGQMEGIYAASGDTPVTPTPEPNGEWEIRCEYRNHNTGHHSEVAIIGDHRGRQCGNSLSMYFSLTGFQLSHVKDWGGMKKIAESVNGFSLIRDNFYNANDHFEFNIQIVASDSQYQGSVGETGHYIPCSIFCTGYTEG